LPRKGGIHLVLVLVLEILPIMAKRGEDEDEHDDADEV